MFLGKTSTGLSLLALSGMMAAFPLIGLFFLRNPVQGRSANLADELEKYKLQYPGWKGKIVYYGLSFAFVLIIFLRIAGLGA